MKIIVIGGSGTLGKAIVSTLSSQHEVISVGHTRGEWQVDITSSASIRALYERIRKFDAVIAATGAVVFAPLNELDETQYLVGLHSKLMGQVNLVRIGLEFMNDGGSFTLTSGILNHDPIRTGASAAMVNGALEGFVKSAALEMPRQGRINIVSPTVFTESMPVYGPYFSGFESVPVQRVALAYQKSVEGLQTGQCYQVWR